MAIALMQIYSVSQFSSQFFQFSQLNAQVCTPKFGFSFPTFELLVRFLGSLAGFTRAMFCA
jgi:hypothetical protein